MNILAKIAFFLIVVPTTYCVFGQTKAYDAVGFETPSSMMSRVSELMVYDGYKIIKDEIVDSDYDSDLKLRRIEINFSSKISNNRVFKHPSVIYIPITDNATSGSKKNKVVVVGRRNWSGNGDGPWRDAFLENYGESIAAQTGYPVMVCPVPREYEDEPGKEISIRFLIDLYNQTKDPIHHHYMRLAIPYLLALDVMADILEVDDKISAVIGGHSKRATEAYMAAAIDSQRITGVVYMGNETEWGKDSTKWRATSPFLTQKMVKADVLYIGATNEDGYSMYDINKIQESIDPQWSIEYIPNYRHAPMSEKHFMNWNMWIKHVFEERPITVIDSLSFTEVEEGYIFGGRSVAAGTAFRAKIQSPNKIIQAKI
ncbi:MAG: hypothetical protein KAR19_05370 [Bacteroidales bacterium]|nr:hypothetical protein [Bacteroidales bacterium]